MRRLSLLLALTILFTLTGCINVSRPRLFSNPTPSVSWSILNPSPAETRLTKKSIACTRGVERCTNHTTDSDKSQPPAYP